MTDTIEVREINELVLADAFAALAPVTPSPTRWSKVNAHPTVDVSVPFIIALRDEIAASEPVCDHSVGICACGAAGALRELNLWLEHKQTCPTCAGDGFDYEDHMKTCETCNGKGEVAL